MGEWTAKLEEQWSLWWQLGRNWLHKFACDLHVYICNFYFFIFLHIVIHWRFLFLYYHAIHSLFQNIIRHGIERSAIWRHYWFNGVAYSVSPQSSHWGIVYLFFLILAISWNQHLSFRIIFDWNGNVVCDSWPWI